jgi:cysteine-rich repeat protein
VAWCAAAQWGWGSTIVVTALRPRMSQGARRPTWTAWWVLTVVATGCSLDGAEKDRCHSDSDCRPGRLCLAGRCDYPDGGRETNDGAGDRSAPAADRIESGENRADQRAASFDFGGSGGAAGDARPGDAGLAPDTAVDRPQDVVTTDQAPCHEGCESCGDRTRQGLEACDDGNRIDDDECTNDCTLPRCGDGVTQVGEECDSGSPDGDMRCTGGCAWIPFRQLAATASRICAVRENGSVACWGHEPPGSDAPIGPFVSVVPGPTFACGLRLDGSVECSDGVTPPPPAGRFDTLAVGDGFACAIRPEGELVCWGEHAQSPPMGTFTRVAVGERTACAIRNDGQVICWGSWDELIANAPTGRYVDVAMGKNACVTAQDGVVTCWPMMGSPGVALRQVDLSGAWGCGLREDGEVHCWGNNVPEPLPGPYLRVVSTGQGICGLRPQGTISCWGPWPLPTVSPTSRPTRAIAMAGEVLCTLGQDGAIRCGDPLPQVLVGPFVELSVFNHVCGLRQDGTVGCAGPDEHGQSDAPSGRFKQVIAGQTHSCAIDVSGAVRCWGANDLGQATPPSGSFTRLAVTTNRTCGLYTDGTAVCWGSDTLLDGGPAAPPGPFVELDGGSRALCGVRASGAVVCTGRANVALLAPPQQIFHVSVGNEKACGLRPAGELECWAPDPPQRALPRGAFRSVAVDRGTCALRRNGTVVCWGSFVVNLADP